MEIIFGLNESAKVTSLLALHSHLIVFHLVFIYTELTICVFGALLELISSNQQRIHRVCHSRSLQTGLKNTAREKKKTKIRKEFRFYKWRDKMQ